MSKILKIRRGLESELPILALGELGFTTDENALYVGGLQENKRLTKIDSDGFVNVKDHGVKGDAVTDDTQAIQALINDTTYGTLYFPKGIYRLSHSTFACLSINRTVNLIGEGMTKTYFQPFNTVPSNVSLIQISGQITAMTISGIGFPHPAGGSPLNHVIHIDISEVGDFMKNSIIQNCYFEEFNGNAIKLTNPINTDGFFTSKIRDCFIYGGINLERSGDSVIIEGNVITGVKTAINLTTVSGSYRTLITKNNITADDGQIVMNNASEVTIIDNQIEQTTARASTDGALLEINGGFNIIIENNNLDNNGFLDYVIQVDNTRNIVIDKNQMHTGADHIEVKSGSINTWIGYKNNPRRNGNQYNNLRVSNVGEGTTNVDVQLTLLNSWIANDVANHGNPRFVKTDNGIVQLKGQISGGTATSGTELFTLPTWARPDKVEYHLCYSFDGSTFVQGVLQILPAGHVYIRGGSNVQFSLENVTFYAKNYLL